MLPTELYARPELALITRGLTAYYDFKRGPVGLTFVYDYPYGRFLLPITAGATAPVPNNAGFLFDGSDDVVGDGTSVVTQQAFSVMAVVNGTGTGNRTIVGCSANGALQLRLDTAGTMTVNRANTAAVATSNSSTYDLQWVGVGFTRVASAAAHQFYRNGIADGAASTPSVTFTFNNFRIGKSVTNEPFAGTIAAVLVYDGRALTADEVLQNHRALQAILSPRGVPLP